jgi:hypothetical protein
MTDTELVQRAASYFSFAGQVNKNSAEDVDVSLETEMVWLRPEYLDWPFVRQGMYRTRLKSTRALLVAYAKAHVKYGRRSNAPPLPYTRKRLFYVQANDPYGSGSCPTQGVDPRTIQAGQWACSPTPEQLLLLGPWMKFRSPGDRRPYWEVVAEITP